MATGNVLLSDDWVPHVREPSFDNRSKLAGVVRKLSMNGNNIMAEIITRDQVLSVTSIEGMLSMVRNWTRPEWNTPDPMHPGLPPSQAVIASESVKRAGNALNLLYRISEKTNREEDWALVDEWAEVWIESMLRASACHLPILPQETLAALVTAAVDTSLGSWDAGKALTLWNQLVQEGHNQHVSGQVGHQCPRHGGEVRGQALHDEALSVLHGVRRPEPQQDQEDGKGLGEQDGAFSIPAERGSSRGRNLSQDISMNKDGIFMTIVIVVNVDAG